MKQNNAFMYYYRCRSFPVWSRIVGSFSHLFLVLNSGTNILFYCCFNRQFRLSCMWFIYQFVNMNSRLFPGWRHEGLFGSALAKRILRPKAGKSHQCLNKAISSINQEVVASNETWPNLPLNEDHHNSSSPSLTKYTIND